MPPVLPIVGGVVVVGALAWAAKTVVERRVARSISRLAEDAFRERETAWNAHFKPDPQRKDGFDER